MINVRELSTLAEFSDAVRLQQCIWGFTDIEVFPLRFYIVVSKIGGLVLGAFDGAEMVGFSQAMPGIKPDGRAYWHSHMLAVVPAYRNQGLGRRLKLEQRARALARGIGLIEWTFDPLNVKNAYFNLECLGAIVRRYAENQYGEGSSSLDQGMPTDRCFAEWWIGDGAHEATRAKRKIDERIAVPAGIDRMRREDPERARQIQRANAARFQACFAGGLAVIGFERGEQQGVYLLGRWP